METPTAWAWAYWCWCRAVPPGVVVGESDGDGDAVAGGRYTGGEALGLADGDGVALCGVLVAVDVMVEGLAAAGMCIGEFVEVTLNVWPAEVTFTSPEDTSTVSPSGVREKVATELGRTAAAHCGWSPPLHARRSRP